MRSARILAAAVEGRPPATENRELEGLRADVTSPLEQLSTAVVSGKLHLMISRYIYALSSFIYAHWQFHVT